MTNNNFLNWLDAGKDVIVSAATQIISNGQMSLKDYLAQHSKELDKWIIELENQGVGKFVAGEVTMKLTTPTDFTMIADFYLKSNNGDLIKKTRKSGNIDLRLALIPADQNTLLTKKEIKYDYEKP